MRERSTKEVREVVGADEAPLVTITVPRQKRPDTELQAKEVRLGNLRYIVCRNPAEAERDAAEREAILRSLRVALFGIDKLNVPRSDIPAVTHVDYSVRIQTVHQETNPRYHALLSACKARTGCPVLVNTSFNVRGEPIVCTPEDAFRCFMGTEIETLAIANCLLKKKDQDPGLKLDYKDTFELD